MNSFQKTIQYTRRQLLSWSELTKYSLVGDNQNTLFKQDYFKIVEYVL